MFKDNNFIAFHDLSPGGNFLWVSSSIIDVLGYTSEDLIGVSGYDIIVPEDIPITRVVHKENLLNDLVASQVVIRYIAKDGRCIPCICVFSLCYDFLLNCVTAVDPNAGDLGSIDCRVKLQTYLCIIDSALNLPGLSSSRKDSRVRACLANRHLRAHSAAMTRIVGSKREEFERLQRHHRAFAASSWNHNGMEPEPRIRMILNRFSRDLIIMYASPACESVFHIDPEQIVGKPILLFVRAGDLTSFVEQVDVIKSSTAIIHMRFWFQSPNWPEEIPCEAMLFGCADGIVALMRRCEPFLRKQLIGGSEHYGPSKNTSSNSSLSSPTKSSYSSATATSMSSPSPKYKSSSNPLRNAPMSRIKKIKIVDRDDDRITRPFEEVINVDPNLAQEVNHLPKGFGIKEYRMQGYDEDYEKAYADFNDDQEIMNNMNLEALREVGFLG
ncbi:hypothetical protein BGX26_003367 [Mortierella sp. AD094]|nr:hypothetical protein BGX26_003367 [Mortierella sp. AD094]